MKFSVAALHVWASMIVYAVTIKGIDNDTISNLWDGLMWAIPATLFVLVGDKGAQNLIAARFGMQRVEEITTKTVQTTAESKVPDAQ